jgi:hypothetical protein
MSSLSSKFSLTPQRRIYYGGILLFAALIGIVLAPSDLFIQGGIVFAGSVMLFAFLINIRYGLYAMAVFSFFSNWFIDLAQYEWSKNITYLGSINAQVVDFIAMLVAVGFCLAWLLQFIDFKLKDLKHLWRLMILYGFFVGWSIFSALHAFEHRVGTSLKYVARPIIFVFLLFLLLPNALIRTRETLEKVLYIWFVVGVGIALYGLSSLIIVRQSGWWRVVPYGINHLAPLGYNHNLIAEVLIPIIPIGVFLAIKAWQRKERNSAVIMGGGTILILLAELLTLSRAGWICCVVQAVLTAAFFVAEIKVFLKNKIHVLIPLAVVGILIIGYMGVFLRSSVVSSSDKARYTVTEIVIFYVERSPWHGYGPGMFIPVFESTHDYVDEFGEALDGHGFIQKISLEEGVAGLGLFVISLAYMIFIVWREFRFADHAEDRELMMMCLIMMSGVIVFQLFNTSYFNSVMWMPLGVGLSAAGLLYRRRHKI